MNAEEIDISATVSPALLHALGQLLRGLALARRDLGLLDADTAIALEAACKRLAEGDFDGDFPNAAGNSATAALKATGWSMFEAWPASGMTTSFEPSIFLAM